MWRMYKELFNGGWRISDSWWAHFNGLVKYHVTGNAAHDPLAQYMVNNPEKVAEAIMDYIDKLI